MSDDSLETEERTQSGVFIALLGFAVFASAATLVWSYTLESRLEKSQATLANVRQQNDKLAESLNETNAKLSVTSETLGRSVGLTQRQLELRAKEFAQRQQAETSRLEKEQAAAQAATNQQIGAVSTDVTSVKTDVGGVKTDVAATKNELQAAEAKLQRVTGDLGVTSGLVATNGKELEILKHKGDRNYYDLNLTKGAKPTPISGVSLALKKADSKRSKYTLVVESDDKMIEKKDKSLDEPVQFYTGKDKLLYELVINTINKNQVIGYLATPKNAPAPLQP
jgi:predicted  nucleic acid-binding Zn-ribbon protein